MTLTELRYIVAVAREGHFGRAAESCFVSQPTLSLGVKKIEQELGVTLFERGHHEVVLAAEARPLIEQAARILEQAQYLRALAKRSAMPMEGTLRIGAIGTVGPYLLPYLLPMLHERAPGLSLVIEEQLEAQLTDRLKRGELDLVLVSMPYREAGIETMSLYEEPLVVVLPIAHPLTRKSAISMADLTEETVLLLGEGHCFRDQVLALQPHWEHMPAAAPGANPKLEGSSLETIRCMVASGIGVSVLPCSAAGADRYAQRLVTIRRFAGTSPTRTVALAWRGTYARTAAVDLLADAIRQCPLSGVRMLAPAPTPVGKSDDRTGRTWPNTPGATLQAP